MKVMVIGNGAREHTLVWKIKQSPKVDELFAAPGNAGTAGIAQNLDISATDLEALAKAAEDRKIDLTVVGPEAPLAAGIVDLFQKRNLRVFGPTKAAAQIEASKVFSKNIMQKYGIPCAQGEVFSSYSEARDYVKSRKAPMVIKADGLAAGKGVTVAASKDQALEALSDAMEKKTLGDAGNTVIVEECLVGKEVSLLAFTDGKSVSPMVPACDYKRVFDADKGPNTGGMGGYSPPGFFSQEMVAEALRTVLEPTVRAMATEKMPYRGVLYAGLMITASRHQGAGVQRQIRRPGDPGHAAATQDRPGGDNAGRDRRQAGQDEHRMEPGPLRRRGDGLGRLPRQVPDRLPHNRPGQAGQGYHGLSRRNGFERRRRDQRRQSADRGGQRQEHR